MLLPPMRVSILLRCLIAAMAVYLSGVNGGAFAETPRVTGIAAEYRHGQTFVTWKDVAEGEAGAKYRYSLYRSDKPITAENLPQAELCYHGVMNNSAKEFGYAFNMKDRLDPSLPTTIIVEGGKPLPMWSGLAVRTVRKDGDSYYAVVASDLDYKPLSQVVPGESSLIKPVAEKVAPIQPIKLYDSTQRKAVSNPKLTSVLSEKNLPLRVNLHASQGQGGNAGDFGDYYLYFATAEMGWRDGLPGAFTVRGTNAPQGKSLVLSARDAIEHPSGTRAAETIWFGYYCVPQGATHAEPRAYPFTERRMLWLIDWVCQRYEVDRHRMHAGGGSMGAWGSTTFAFRQRELFAAVYPDRPRTIQKGLPSLLGGTKPKQGAFMADGKTDYFERMNMVKFASAAPAEDLPFYAWCCGRRDGFASWQEQIDMVKSLSAAKRGFAFAWNNGNHGGGSDAMRQVTKYYPPTLFALNKSYPAFCNSSINGNLGTGDPADGDLEGGINLGFSWGEVKETPTSWSVEIGNSLNKSEMTADLTPRRCQKFKAQPGEKYKFTTSTGAAGNAIADRDGLITLEKVVIKPGVATTVTIQK